MKKIENVVVLGSGPAGITASIYLARANLNPLLITGFTKGGQLSMAHRIENWPGFFEELKGLELVEKMFKHVKKFVDSKKIVNDMIESVNFKKKPFKLIGQNTIYFCNALIIATGTIPRHLGLKSEKKFNGLGVSFCANCDGFLYKGEEVAVIGGGNSAIEDALYLSRIASKVHLVHRRNSFRAEKILIRRIMEKIINGNIVFHSNFVVKEIFGDDQGVKSLELVSTKENNLKKNLFVTGVFIAIGRVPNTKIFSEDLILENNYIKVRSKINDGFTNTSVSGVFAAGDVIDPIYCQAVTSAGSGCMAAIDVEKYLNLSNI